MHTKTKCEWAVMATAALMMLGAASVAPAQQFNPLVNFDLTNGSVPQASLVQGAGRPGAGERTPAAVTTAGRSSR